MMTKPIYYLVAIMIATISPAETLIDSDLDGVPDRLDQCQNTPFLHEVDRYGCTTKILKLPQQSDQTNLTLSLGYGYTTNEDLYDDKEHLSSLQLRYYHDSWSYSLKGAYDTDHEHTNIQDTIVKVKKRFRLSPTINLSLGAGIKLPTLDVAGNQTDYTLYQSLHYYPSASRSYFAGAHYTRVNDDPISLPLQDSYALYLGSGYFITKQFYANLSYSYTQTKYRYEESYHMLSNTLYYKINQTFFTTATYQRAVGDDDLHDGLVFKVGYRIW